MKWMDSVVEGCGRAMICEVPDEHHHSPQVSLKKRRPPETCSAAAGCEDKIPRLSKRPKLRWAAEDSERLDHARGKQTADFRCALPEPRQARENTQQESSAQALR